MYAVSLPFSNRPAARHHLQAAIDLVGECYAGCTPVDFRLLRQTLCDFFQGACASMRGSTRLMHTAVHWILDWEISD